MALALAACAGMYCPAAVAQADNVISIAITAPVDGSIVTPGSTIRVAAKTSITDHRNPISNAIVLSSVVGAQLPAPDYSASLALPPTFSGVLTLVAFARNQVTFGQSPPVTVLVAPNDTLTSLTATPNYYRFSVLGGTRSLGVVGTYAGGETADVSDHRFSTTYRSSAINVVTVSADGLVTAVGNGTAQITIQNGSSQVIVPITVTAPTQNSPPVANAGPNQTLHPCQSVTLIGSQSYDPNGQLLSFAWTQTSGPSVTFTNASSANPSFVAPDRDGVLQFSLLVTDFAGLSATASTTVAVRACEKEDSDHRCRQHPGEMMNPIPDRPEWATCRREKEGDSHR